MNAALTGAFVCTLLLVVDSAPQAINPDCVFPFIYKGVSYQGCTTKDHSTMWCATTSNYDSDRRWIECYGKAFNPDCVFPFIYKGETYQSCTTKGHSAMWCATTSNYDSDRRWIECYGRGENVALGGRATQSTIVAGAHALYGYTAHAINAVDGNPDPNASHGSCSHTDYEYGPWWRLDLLKPLKIYAIYITNRDSFAERLNGADILVGNSLTNYGNNNERCGHVSSIAAGTTQAFHCYGLVGRYVNVVIRGRKECLTLCEVQVFAEPESENQGK
ncbi:fucolectin-4-like [Lissotriton helveticus]